MAALPLPTPARSFVVLGLHRTGSTLLCSLLDSHPDVTCAKELFKQARGLFPGRVKRWSDESPAYVQHLLDSRWRELGHACPWTRRGVVRRYLDGHFGVRPDGAVGLKLLLSQVRFRPEVVDDLARRRVCVVRLVRRNLLEILVSHKVWNATGITSTCVEVETPTVELDAATVIRDLERIQRRYVTLASVLPHDEGVTIAYEDVSVDPGAACRPVFEQLGLDPAVRLKTTMKKVVRGSLQDKVLNYEQIAAILRGTGFESFLDDQVVASAPMENT